MKIREYNVTYTHRNQQKYITRNIDATTPCEAILKAVTRNQHLLADVIYVDASREYYNPYVNSVKR